MEAFTIATPSATVGRTVAAPQARNSLCAFGFGSIWNKVKQRHKKYQQVG